MLRPSGHTGVYRRPRARNQQWERAIHPPLKSRGLSGASL
jgi:hypothetical protein